MVIAKHRTRGRNGPCTTRNFYLDFTDHHGRTHRRLALPRGLDERGAKVFADNVQTLVSNRMSDLAPEPAIIRWLENIPPRIRERLVVLNLLKASRAAAGQPLSEHIDAFEAALKLREKTPKHTAMTIAQVKDIVDNCEFKVWSDVTEDAVAHYLKELREGPRHLSKVTANHYHTSMKSFCDWMVAKKRATENPLADLEKVHVAKKDRKHLRTALTVEEVKRLLAATIEAPDDYGMTGHERALLYLFAIETGLRADAIRSLTVSSIDWEHGSVFLPDHESKNGEEVVVPLTDDMLRHLRTFSKNRLPMVKLFGGTYQALTDKTSPMLQADLARTVVTDKVTGRVLVPAIPYKTCKGEHHDFHGFRHTGYSWLEARGVPRQIIMQIFGHKSMAMGTIYAHPDWLAMKEGVSKLPPFEMSIPVRATGTDAE